MMAASPVTLGELLGDPTLGLRLVSGDERSVGERPLRGAHAIELPEPGKWIEPDWLVCTTGALVCRHPEAQRELIRNLHSHGAAAMGFGVGIAVGSVPDPLIEQARALGFPVVAVPEPVRFHDLISRITSAMHDGELALSQRISAMQRYLLDALNCHSPRTALLQRLARITESSVAIFDANGRRAAAIGSVPSFEIPNVSPQESKRTHEIELDGYAGLAAPLEYSDEYGRGAWLVVVRKSRAPHLLTKHAAETALAVLSGMDSLARSAREQVHATRQAVLDTIVETTDRVQERIAAARARSLGVELEAGPVVISIEYIAAQGDSSQLLCLLHEHLEAAGLAYLATTSNRAAWAIVAGEEEVVGGVLEDALGQREDLVAGVGPRARSCGELGSALAGARLAAERARGSRDAKLQSFRELSLSTVLLGQADQGSVERMVGGTLGPLMKQEDLLSTLETYFHCDLNVIQAALLLNLHPNSLRYRIARIEDLLGESLRQPSTIANLYLALTARASGMVPTSHLHEDERPDGNAQGRRALAGT